MKKLPIGISTLRKIREAGAVYIDKTPFALDLINNYHYVFLSRPRRFGKSLLVDTLKELFEGNKKLFAGLAAEKQHDWSRAFPVILLSLAKGFYRTPERFTCALHEILAENEKRLGVKTTSDDIALRFDQLIRAGAAAFGEQVVVLVDEYDKPILDNLDQPEMASQAREELRALYSSIKANDTHIRFAFLTGVSKFSKVSIFSGLNNLEDISLTPQYGAICGYTQRELEQAFYDHLDGVDMLSLKTWYDGYNFLGDNVYNPFDVLLFLKNNKEYGNYWFETGTPSFLVKMIKEKRFYLPELTNITAGDELLNSFDIDNINLITMLFQTGYLTIKEVQRLGRMRQYLLDFPNLEVSTALNNALLAIFALEPHQKSALQMNGYAALLSADMEQFHAAIRALFAAIPYNHFAAGEIACYEGFYVSVLYAWLASSQLVITMEDCTSKGRIDMSIILDEMVYIIEFKVDDEGAAMAQIKARGYAEKFADRQKTIFLIGISFDSRERNISEFVWETA